MITAAIEKAKNISRREALVRVEKSKVTQRPVFVVSYDPRLPSISGIVKKHWRTMVHNDPHLKESFPLPPLVAYKRPPNIKDKLIRAKVPTSQSGRPKRNLPGMRKCNNCPICPFVQPGKTVKSTATKFSVEINTEVNCQTRNIVYCITCQKCRVQYVGESDRTLQTRFSEHRSYVTNQKLYQATGNHFNSPGHNVADIKVTILEKIHSRDELVRLEREDMFIKNMNTKYRGLNKK